MKQVFSYNIVLVLLTLPSLSIGQFVTEKVLSDTVSIEDFAEIRVENEYGNIVITTWD